jgi:hypothetical protein
VNVYGTRSTTTYERNSSFNSWAVLSR